ncbi:MAG: hypothetical protein JNM17_34430 [Archangium sp.]|nr:hypothetical protein [Archangium sp.]
MEPLSAFDAALSNALRIKQGKQRLAGGALLGLGVVLLVGLIASGLSQVASAGGVLIIVGLVVLFQSTQTGPLGSLRGGTPEHWLPSKSHGVVAVKGDQLLGGGFSATLDRHSRIRVSSVSYDETAHGVLVQLISVVPDRNGGEREVHSRELVLLDASVTADRGFAFAKKMLELSER